MRTILCLLFCAQAWSASVDVNDVSLLWPPPSFAEQVSNLVGLNEFVPPKVFDQIVSFASGEELQGVKLPKPLGLSVHMKTLKNWRISSLRLDPCAPGLRVYEENPSKCIQEVRLVAQPIAIHDWGLEYGDMAMHILLEVDVGDPANSKNFRKIWDAYLAKKIELGIETSGVPLTIHPGFQSKKFAEWLEVHMGDITSVSRLKKITFAGATKGIGPWVFFQGLVKGDLYELENEASLRGQPHGFIVPKKPGMGGEIFPTPLNRNSLGETFGPSVADLFYLGDINLQDFATLGNGEVSSKVRKIDVVHLVDNPAITNRTNTDCFSCHTATTRALQMKIADSESEFRFVAPTGKTDLGAHLDKTVTNLRAFGWFGSKPVAVQRVVNESAAVAAFMEKLFE